MIQTLNDTQKRIAIGVGLGIAVLGVSMGLLGVQIGTIIQGLFPAIASGLAAASLVLVYRTIRVINFAQLTLSIIATQLFYELYTKGIMPYPFAILIGLIAGIVVGALVGILSATLFFRHPRLVMTVVTIFMVGIITYIQTQIQQIFTKPGIPDPIKPIIGPWPNWSIKISGIPFRFAHILGMVLLLAVSIGLVLFFRWTRVGTAVRASAENADRASLLGINVKLLQVGVWTLVGFIASLTALAIMPVTQYSQTANIDQTLLLLPLSAAVVARMSSMPVAFFAALGLELMAYSISAATSFAALTNVGLFVVLMFGLLWQRRKIQVRADETTSWKAMKEVRPTPKQLLKLGAIRNTRVVLMVVASVLALAIPWMLGGSATSDFSEIWIYAIVATSLVVLTGWTGQISLGQMALVLIGAFVGGNMTMRMHIPFWIALPLAGLVGALVAFLIGIPALRIRGLFLAAATFALAIVMPLFAFDTHFLGKYAPTEGVVPPKLLFLDFSDSRSMYYLCTISFFLVVLAVQALRKSRGGRVLIALRDNENGVQSFGIDVVKARLTAFALSGFIAAFAGVLLIHKQRGMSITNYNAFASITVFILVVIGGVSSVAGAILGSLFFIGGALLLSPNLQAILTGITGLIVLMAIPGGLTQVVFGARDAVLRVIAMRQHIIVPSLFADYSPDAWERKLAPLSPAVPSQGLGALGPEQRYSRESKILGRATV